MFSPKAARILAVTAFVAALALGVAALGDGATGRATAPFRIHLPALSNDEYHAPVTTTPSPSPTATATATPTATPGTPSPYTVTLTAGQGFRFEPPAITTDGHDLYWNGASLLPAGGAAIQRLADFRLPPPTDGYSTLPLVPKAGDAFAFKLPPRDGSGPAPRATLGVSSVAGSITFTWRYFGRETCDGAHATIIALDKTAQLVTVQGAGDMTGWKLVTMIFQHEIFTFPAGWLLNGTAQIRADTVQFHPTTTMVWWTQTPLWTAGVRNDVRLYNCEGTLVQTWVDGQ